MENILIRSATTDDAAAICRIYNHYVLNTIITFEEQAVSSEEMALRISEIQTASLPWIVIEEAGQVAGFAYASKWRLRQAYRFSAESTVYVDSASLGKGFGNQLYTALLPLLREQGMHVVIGGIALPNTASVALHEHMGFTKVAHFNEVGFKLNQWIDVGYWQLSL